MGKPAARIDDNHVCPAVNPPPHVGGPVLPSCSPNVIIGGKAAARVGDKCKCNAPPDEIVTGSATVLINGKKAARLSDSTAHGGKIVQGDNTVLIGDTAQAGCMKAAAQKGAPFVKKHKEVEDDGEEIAMIFVAAAAIAAAASSSGSGSEPAPTPAPEPEPAPAPEPTPEPPAPTPAPPAPTPTPAPPAPPAPEPTPAPPAPTPAPPAPEPTPAPPAPTPAPPAPEPTPAPPAPTPAPTTTKPPEPKPTNVVRAGDKPSQPTAADKAVVLHYGARANKEVISGYTEHVLKEILYKAGERSATITSTIRTPYDQARIMYGNIEAYGTGHQYNLYGSGGDQLIDTYVAGKRAGKSRAQIIADMEAKAKEIGPGKVSKHCADPKKLQVVDISPSSITNDAKFMAGVNADSRVSKFIPPPADPAYHIEIPQPQDGQSVKPDPLTDPTKSTKQAAEDRTCQQCQTSRPPEPKKPAEVPTEPNKMEISENGLRFIAGWESFSATLYDDQAGHSTIGYGHLVHYGRTNGSEPAEFRAGISKTRALVLLRQDARIAERAVQQKVKVKLSQTQFDALVSFTFNVGNGAFADSTLLRILNKGDYAGVPAQMNRWVKAGGKTSRGLVNRRREEGALFQSGSYGSRMAQL